MAAGQPSGDDAVDEVLDQLDKVADEALDVQIEVIERVHTVLQDRLADLGHE
jgi:chaperonin cofactor prefoldin